MGKPEAVTQDALQPRWRVLAALVLLTAVVVGTAGYVNMSFAVTNKEALRFYPPFRPGWDRNMNDHLGGEYWSIAKAMYAGRGFADPFREPTGPTAWMAPAFPALLTGLLWLNDGSTDAVMNAVIALQAAAVIGGCGLVLMVARRTAPQVPVGAIAGTIVVGVLAHFTLTFQMTHDSGLVLLTLTAILGWICCGRPLRSARSALGWGILGGVSALVGPVLAFVWGALTLFDGRGRRASGRALLSGLTAAAVLAPWAIHNYRTFGRVIPVKSNLGYELYQSQCLEPDGIIRLDTFRMHHPYGGAGAEREEYTRLGEMVYLDRKMAAFLAAVRADPESYAVKVGNRLLAATVVYVPLNEKSEDASYWGLWISRVTHALPFLSAVFLLITAGRFGLLREQALILLAYAVYLAPYVLIGYYERYAYPLLAVKVLLIVWAGDRLTRMAAGRGSWSVESDRGGHGPVGPMLHRWAAGLVICGGLWWWYGGAYEARLAGQSYDRFGNTALTPDFFQVWQSARQMRDGKSVYTPSGDAPAFQGLAPGTIEWQPALAAYPPGAILLAIPLGRLDFPDALAVWNALSLAAVVCAALLVYTRLGCAVPGWAVIPAATAFALSNPFWEQIVYGPFDSILLLLLTGAWASARAGKQSLAGFLVGAAAVIEVFPGFVLVYFVLTGRWRAVLAAILWVIAGVGLTSTILGWDVWATYLTRVVPVLKEFAAGWPNASLMGWWLKLFAAPNPWPAVRPWPITICLPVALAGTLATAMALTFTLWRQTRPRRPAAGADRGFAAAVVGALLVSPVTLSPSFVLLLLPVAVLWRDLPPNWCRGVFWTAVAMLTCSPFDLVGLGMTLVGVFPDQPAGIWESPPWLTATILSTQTYALLTLLILLLSIREESVLL